jgi:hypothetical protein
MQIGILPVLETAVAIESWTGEMDGLKLILEKPDVPSEKQMLALCAKAHFIQRPPLLERIMSLQEFEFAAKGGE